jgi:hypothetical protein
MKKKNKKTKISKFNYISISTIMIIIISLIKTFAIPIIQKIAILFSADKSIKITTLNVIYSLITLTLLILLILGYILLFTKYFKSFNNRLICALILFEYFIILLIYVFSNYFLRNHDYNIFAYINVLQLLVCSFISVLIIKIVKSNKQNLFWLISSFGFLFLSLDELFEFHEYLGNIIIYPLIKSTSLGLFISNFFYHPDDCILVIYALIGFIILLIFYKLVLFYFKKYKTIFIYFFLGVISVFFQIISEKNKFYFLEEVFEIYMSLFFIIFLYLIHYYLKNENSNIPSTTK